MTENGDRNQNKFDTKTQRKYFYFFSCPGTFVTGKINTRNMTFTIKESNELF
jgi:hypothetical protein